MSKRFIASKFCRDASLPDDLQGFLRPNVVTGFEAAANTRDRSGVSTSRPARR
jgi:hypothetical protein